MDEYIQQTAAAPLYPNVLWNRPISRGSAGTLMVIGGHATAFEAAQASYQYAVAAGAGKCRVILPDSLRKLLEGFDDTWFVPSSPSGSIGRGALGEIDHLLQSADGVLLGPNLSSNSETAIVTEKITSESTVPLTLVDDAIESLTFNPSVMLGNPRCAVVVDMNQLFKIANAQGIALSIRPDRGILGRVDIVRCVAEGTQAAIVCVGQELIIACGGQVSVTPALTAVPREMAAAVTATWWQWRNGDPFERLTTAAYICAAALVANQDSATVVALSKQVEKIVDAF